MHRDKERVNPDCCLPCRLKAALARRTGRSEEELCFEERRRSARVAEEENLSLDECGLVMERGNRRARKEEPKLSDVRICFSVSLLLEVDHSYIFIFYLVCDRVRALPMPAFQSLKGR